MFNAKRLQVYPQEDPVGITQAAWWVPGAVWSVQDVATRYTDPQLYTELGTEMNMAVLAGFLEHLFERNRKRGHGVLPNNLRQSEGEYF